MLLSEDHHGSCAIRAFQQQYPSIKRCTPSLYTNPDSKFKFMCSSRKAFRGIYMSTWKQALRLFLLTICGSSNYKYQSWLEISQALHGWYLNELSSACVLKSVRKHVLIILSNKLSINLYMIWDAMALKNASLSVCSSSKFLRSKTASSQWGLSWSGNSFRYLQFHRS